jgi:two-component system LytT family response regulator
VKSKLRAFVVDDEPLALRRLVRLLEATGRVDVVGRATDPEAALADLAAATPDVLFLDIQMPGLDGFQLLDRLPVTPMVVFTTAYDHHAVHAFETNAVDYLLKPVERARLDRTLERLARLRDDPGRDTLRSVLERVAESLRTPAFVERLASRVGERVDLVDVARVTHIAARDRATYAVTPEKEYLLDQTIAELERKLDPGRFLRIHRSTLVNLAWVAEIHAHLGGRLLLRLKGNGRMELEVARDRVRALKERLGL